MRPVKTWEGKPSKIVWSMQERNLAECVFTLLLFLHTHIDNRAYIALVSPPRSLEKKNQILRMSEYS